MGAAPFDWWDMKWRNKKKKKKYNHIYTTFESVIGAIILFPIYSQNEVKHWTYKMNLLI